MNKSESKYFNTAKKMDKALISLLEEKAFEYITVSEICKRAEVNRSTFYLHYENTADLLNETARFLLNDFAAYFNVDVENITEKFKADSLDELNFISDAYLHPYLSYIKENRILFSTILSHSVSFGFNEIFQRLYDNIFNPILEKYNYPATDRKYAMMFYLNGITAVVTEWLKDGCQKTIEEVSQIIYGCIFGRENKVI
ncbi:MAG: TetR/AcrR family transcriptional regulator [Ruminococcaceae bacterium]|nr:TetR/AcrR family transcriptional regulator [Oscillospiraceae bacterium]